MTQKTQTILIAAVVAAIVVTLISLLNAPDQRTAGQKIGDAVDQFSNGADKAARELKDRTPAQKLGDAVDDAGDDLKKATDRN